MDAWDVNHRENARFRLSDPLYVTALILKGANHDDWVGLQTRERRIGCGSCQSANRPPNVAPESLENCHWLLGFTCSIFVYCSQ